jgi:N-acetylmuramoyl-L-alanine amidase
MTKNVVVINIGHGYNGDYPFDNGACSADGSICEYEWNKELAHMIRNESINIDSPYEIEIVEQDSYASLPAKINNIDCDCVISLHLNGFDFPTATGTEMLFCDGSEFGHLLADYCYKEVHATLGLPRRYNCVRGLNHNDRGYGLVSRTKPPHIIAESFFITTPTDLRHGNDLKGDIACAYLRGLDRFYVMLYNYGVQD